MSRTAYTFLLALMLLGGGVVHAAESDDPVVSEGTISPSSGGERARANLGGVQIILFDAGDDGVDVNDEMYAAGILDLDGSLPFVSRNTETGNYYWYVSTDIDNNGWICEAGEVCEAYPAFSDSEASFSLTKEDIDGGEIHVKVMVNASSFSASSSVIGKESKKLPLIRRKISTSGINNIEDTGEGEEPLILANSHQFIKSDFLLSREYEEYSASNMLYPQVLVTFIINDMGQEIIATNPAEAEAIKKYVKRVLNFDAIPKILEIIE